MLLLFFFLVLASANIKSECFRAVDVCGPICKFGFSECLRCVQFVNPNCTEVVIDSQIRAGCPGASLSIGCWKCNGGCVGNNCFCQGTCQLFNTASICCNPGQAASCQCEGCDAVCGCY